LFVFFHLKAYCANGSSALINRLRSCLLIVKI